MQTMNFDERTAITREAITLCCEAARIRDPKRRQPSALVRQCIVEDAVAKSINVRFTISTVGISLVVTDTGELLETHITPNISFATGGDEGDYDLIGYVAKDQRNFRECHVFDCGPRAKDIIATIGQAFELRYKAFLRKGGAAAAPAPNPTRALPATPAIAQQVYDDSALYDDAGGVAAQPYGGGGVYGDDAATYGGRGVYGDDAATYGDIGGQVYDDAGGAPLGGEGVYGGDSHYGDATYDAAGGGGGAHYMDTAPVDDSLWDEDVGNLQEAPGADELTVPLAEEPWFHGAVDRTMAEGKLMVDGDFLIREVMSEPGQYVLSIAVGGLPKHIKLVDPQGQVRTHDLYFTGVDHLINYHLRAGIPLSTRSGRYMLGRPVVGRGLVLGGSLYNDAT